MTETPRTEAGRRRFNSVRRTWTTQAREDAELADILAIEDEAEERGARLALEGAAERVRDETQLRGRYGTAGLVERADVLALLSPTPASCRLCGGSPTGRDHICGESSTPAYICRRPDCEGGHCKHRAEALYGSTPALEDVT